MAVGRSCCCCARGRLGVLEWIIFDFNLSPFNTTGFVRSSLPYRPRGVSIFPDRRRGIHTKKKNKQDRNQDRNA